jgi:Fe2+ transport system protein FeoA
MLTASELPVGIMAEIKSIANSPIQDKLAAMGCVPGTIICLEFVAPAGDPMAFNIEGYLLGLRKDEACLLEVIILEK